MAVLYNKDAYHNSLVALDNSIDRKGSGSMQAKMVDDQIRMPGSSSASRNQVLGHSMYVVRS